MNLVKTINQYNNNNLFFCEPMKNNIINDGIFIRILYSTQNIVFNGIYLLIEIQNINSELYYNKFKYSFDVFENMELIKNLKIIEEEILKKYTSTKNPCYKIYQQISSGYIKLFSFKENKQDKPEYSFILKISGIWETDESYGLTYKFIKPN